MEDKHMELARLIVGSARGTLTIGEKRKLDDLAASNRFVSGLIGLYGDERVVAEKLAELEDIPVDEDWEKVLGKYDDERRVVKRRARIRIAAAAAVLLCIGVGVWMSRTGEEASITSSHNSYAHNNDVLPGGSKAILTLSDGKLVELGDAQQKNIVDVATIANENDGVLAYPQSTTRQHTTEQHQLMVPVGGTYAMVLSDGSKVWINADSKLTFNPAFSTHERRITLIGEAYFEIAKDTTRPFIVETYLAEIEALGTAFNVNTHREKGKVKTILTEGKVKITSGSIERPLTVGQEAIADSHAVKVATADLDEALSWKDGYFYFNKKNIREIVHELSRWYGVDVIGKLDDKQKYVGSIKRTATLAKVCALLTDLSGKKFEIKEKTLYVH